MYRIVGVLLTVLFAISAPAHAQKRVALVIGIDTYDNLPKEKQLKKARSDAGAIARTFKELNFDVIVATDLTRSAFNATWVEFVSRLERGDTAAFYFAGHGIELNGQNYLLPRDVPNIEPKAADLIKKESHSLQELLDDLRATRTDLNLVILDACRDNPFPRIASRSVGSAKGLVVTEPPEGTFIMYSAGTGEEAIDNLGESDKDPNSVFTRHLLPLMKTRNLSLTDLAKDVRLSVRKVAAAVRHQQTPAYYDQVVGRVCLAGCAETRPVPRFSIVAPDAASFSAGNVKIGIAIEPTPDPVVARRVIVNGRLVEEWTAELGSEGDGKADRIVDVPLAHGKNNIRLTLSNAIGDKTDTLAVNHEGQGALDKLGTLYLVAIGIDQYQDPGIQRLYFASSDARRFAAAVQKQLGPAHQKVVVRVLANGGSAKDEPTAANVTEALDVFAQTEPTDTSILFLAGNSMSDGQVGLFATTDTQLAGKGSFGGKGVRRSTAVAWQVLQDALETAKGLRVFVVDTNISGRNFNLTPSTTVVTYTAAGLNQNSFEHREFGGGLFTSAFVEALDGRAAPDKRVLTTGDVAKYIKARVGQMAKQMGGGGYEQEPQYFSAGDADEDYVLMRR